MRELGILFDGPPADKVDALRRANHVSEFLLQEIFPAWAPDIEDVQIQIVRPEGVEDFKFIGSLNIAGFPFSSLKERLPYADALRVEQGYLLSRTVLTKDETALTMVLTSTPLTDEIKEEALQLVALFSGGVDPPNQRSVN